MSVQAQILKEIHGILDNEEIKLKSLKKEFEKRGDKQVLDEEIVRKII